MLNLIEGKTFGRINDHIDQNADAQAPATSLLLVIQGNAHLLSIPILWLALCSQPQIDLIAEDGF